MDTNSIYLLGKQILSPELCLRFKNLLWFSYRRGFEPFVGVDPPLDSDAGWGCIMRTGQNAVALSLLRHYFKADSAWLGGFDSAVLRALVLPHFEDSPTATFSIQRIAQMGTKYGKPIGTWFAPSTISNALKELSLSAKPALPFQIYVSMCSAIEIDQVAQQISNSSSAMLLLIPTKLGLNRINPIYYATVAAYMALPQSMGIVGGKPASSYYFVGIENQTLYYLDPHTTQEYVPLSPEFDPSTYFPSSGPKSINIAMVDESLAFVFYCRNQKQFEELCSGLTKAHESCETVISLSTTTTQETGFLSNSSDDFDMD